MKFLTNGLVPGLIVFMNESQAEVKLQPEKKDAETTKTQKTEKKSFFQEIWGGFKEGIKKLWGKAGETLESVNKKAKEISEKISVESVSNYFKTQAENFRDGIEIRGNDITAGWYDFLALTNKGREMFWNKFLGGKAAPWAAENREKAKERTEYAKVIRAKNIEIREKAQKRREEAKALDKAAAKIKGKTANAA